MPSAVSGGSARSIDRLRRQTLPRRDRPLESGQRVHGAARLHHRGNNYRAAVATFSATQSPDHLNTGIARIKLGRSLLRQGRTAEAEVESKAGYDIVAKQTAPTVSWLKSAREDLVAAYDILRRPEEAAKYRAEAARIGK